MTTPPLPDQSGLIPDEEFIGSWEDRCAVTERQLSAAEDDRDRYRRALEHLTDLIADVDTAHDLAESERAFMAADELRRLRAKLVSLRGVASDEERHDG